MRYVFTGGEIIVRQQPETVIREARKNPFELLVALGKSFLIFSIISSKLKDKKFLPFANGKSTNTQYSGNMQYPGNMQCPGNTQYPGNIQYPGSIKYPANI